MIRDTKINPRMRLIALADDLREILLADKIPDDTMVSQVKQVVQVHSMYVQLLSISIAMERLDAIPDYLSVMDSIRDTLDDSVPSLNPDAAIRALSIMNNTVQNTYQVIRDMTTTQDASSVLLSSFLKMVQTGEEEVDTNKEKLKNLSQAEKKKLVAAAEQLLKNVQSAQRESE